MKKELVMYSRTMGCPYISIAKKALAEYNLSYRELYIDIDDVARQRVLDWTGFLSVPTIVLAHSGEDLPLTPPNYLELGASPRGINRGSMITEANRDELLNWLRQHEFIT